MFAVFITSVHQVGASTCKQTPACNMSLLFIDPLVKRSLDRAGTHCTAWRGSNLPILSVLFTRAQPLCLQHLHFPHTLSPFTLYLVNTHTRWLEQHVRACAVWWVANAVQQIHSESKLQKGRIRSVHSATDCIVLTAPLRLRGRRDIEFSYTFDACHSLCLC